MVLQVTWVWSCVLRGSGGRSDWPGSATRPSGKRFACHRAPLCPWQIPPLPVRDKRTPLRSDAPEIHPVKCKHKHFNYICRFILFHRKPQIQTHGRHTLARAVSTLTQRSWLMSEAVYMRSWRLFITRFSSKSVGIMFSPGLNTNTLTVNRKRVKGFTALMPLSQFHFWFNHFCTSSWATTPPLLF